MPEDEIRIKIMADASDLKSGTAEASEAVGGMGEKMEDGTASAGRLEDGLARLSGHMAAHAAGMGRMGMMIARMGESALGAGPFLAAMIPIGALIAGVEIMEKMEEATLKASETTLEVTHAEGKWSDKILDLDEKLTGLTRGPLAEAIEKEKDLAERENHLSEITQMATKRIEESTRWYDKLAVSIERAGIATSNFAFGRQDVAPMDNKVVENRLTLIENEYHRTKDLAGATREYNKLISDVQSAGGPGTEDRVRGIQSAFGILTKQMQAEQIEKKNAAAEVGKIDREQADKRSDLMHKEASEFAALQAQKLKLQSDLARDATNEAEFWSKEQLKMTLEALDTEIEAKKKAWALAGKEIADQERDQQRQLALDIGAIQAGKGTKTGKEGSEADRYAEEAQAIEPLIAKMKGRMALAGPEEAEQLGEKLRQMADMQQQYADKVMALHQKIQMDQQKSVDKMSQTVTTGITGWISGSETFGRAMQQMWQHTAMAAISSMVRMSAQELIGHALHKTIVMDEKETDAKLAATKAWTMAMGLPVPLNFVAAPIMAAAAFAGAMAFEQGGLTGEGGLSVLHPKEMVLPQHLSDFVQKAASGASGDTSNPAHSFNYTAHINAIDSTGMADALKDHGELMFKMVQGQMRNRNLA
jgi:hypothetical protein